ncbi:heavy metal translocating P-type ATPase [Geobacter sulfurreducens]|uniref:heavy metal translocating P-type ATPase n=1 Tax=Geobacter sulfurreducens TaxID=35554 RepID=UPI000DBBAD8E|nr:heavy metal translocating P-type ATPase [Geobacter sulfurreducens]BBA71659.1 putative manganese/zinc-exporting P-type ATPase [Geobacter sulfurreducens]
MRHTIVHETPGRIRLELAVPRFPAVDRCQVEAQFSDMVGVEKASFSPRTGTLLVRYRGGAPTRAALLARVAAAPLPGTRRPRPETELDRKKRIVVRSGALLLARPLIPLPVRPFLSAYGALPIVRKGVAALARRQLNVDVLDATAVGAAMATRDYSRRLLTEMFRTGEEWAWVERDGGEVRLPLEEVQAGDRVVVRMGSLIPVDGVVVAGEALVSQASLTGESLPVLKRTGVMVYAGTAVEEGAITIRAEQVGDETRAARVVKIIEEAEALKAESQSRSEVMADRIVPFSFLASGLTFALTGNAGRAAAVLLVDYSCAIKLSTPLAILTSLARSARHRVLIKGGKYLELLARTDAVVLDKTGTLTEASPRVAEVVAFNGYDRAAILRNAACVEEHFPHPVATAVVRQAEREGLVHPEEHSEVEYVVAHGIASRLDGARIVVGSRHFVHEDEGVDVSPGAPFIGAFARRGDSVLYVAIGGRLAGLIAIHDPLRDEARPFVKALRDSGIGRIVMLTGDNEATAATIAGELGIEEFHAQALPDRKVEVIEALRRQGHTVAMVGDGINDSPALARAHIGVSMKHGADIAREACDVLLLDGTLHDILTARRISQEAMTLVEQNFRTIVVVNTSAMLLAVTGAMPPVFSATIHNLSTILVGLRSLGPLRRHGEA